MQLIDTNEIPLPLWATPKHKITKAYIDGVRHATNHFYDEEPDPNWEGGLDSWAFNPYTPNRPAVYYSFIAGFSEQWANLKREQNPVN